MSDIDDCASQEIDAGASSVSTKDSKKDNFLRSILNVDDGRTISDRQSRRTLSGEKLRRLPRLEKNDFIKNWIVAHSPNVSPQKTPPSSPVLGIPAAKRSPESPILGYRWKRPKREKIVTENFAESESIGNSQRGVRDSSFGARIKIENENSRCFEPIVDSKNESEKTLVPDNFSATNCEPNRGIRNADEKSRTKKWDVNRIFGSNDRRSLVREGRTVQDALSLSSPLGRRNELKGPTIKASTTDDSKITPDCGKKQSADFYEILADESSFGIVLTSSSPKIPETPTLSATIDGCANARAKFENYSGKNLRGDKLERLRRRFSCFSPIKHDGENLFDDKRCDRPIESLIFSDRSSMASPLINKYYDGVESWKRETKKKFPKIETAKFVRNFNRPNIFEESFRSSSQSDKNLVAQNFHSSKRSFSSVNENAGSIAKCANKSWIRTALSPIKLNNASSPQCIDRLTEIRRFSESRRDSSPTADIIESDVIDAESTATNAPEDDVKIESDSDADPNVDFMENLEKRNVATETKIFATADGVNFEGRCRNFVEDDSQRRRENSSDSDETHFSDGESVRRCENTEIGSMKNSQKISQSTSFSREDRVSVNRSEMLISQAASPIGNNNFGAPTNPTYLKVMNNEARKKRRGKKGSALLKLQTIVNSQVSNFRMWQHQRSRSDFENSRIHFVVLKVRERETLYGRHYVTASIVEDAHDLLKSFFASRINSSDKTNDRSSSEKKILTLMIVPEIIGIVKIPADSLLKIYPPWEIMDQDEKILNVMFFNVIPTERENADKAIAKNSENMRITKQFDCPCIRANAMVDCCPVKFSVTKPNVMREIFES